MLILTRRVGETLMIGDQVSVTVLGVKGNESVLVSMLQKKYLFTGKRFTNVFSMNVRCMNIFNTSTKTISLLSKMRIIHKMILIDSRWPFLISKAALLAALIF